MPSPPPLSFRALRAPAVPFPDCAPPLPIARLIRPYDRRLALRFARRATELAPERCAPWSTLAGCHKALGEPGPRLVAARRSVDVCADITRNPAGYTALVGALRAVRRVDEAFALCAPLLAAWPTDSFALRAAGAVYRDAGRPHDADALQARAEEHDDPARPGPAAILADRLAASSPPAQAVIIAAMEVAARGPGGPSLIASGAPHGA